MQGFGALHLFKRKEKDGLRSGKEKREKTFCCHDPAGRMYVGKYGTLGEEIFHLWTCVSADSGDACDRDSDSDGNLFIFL